MSIISESLLKQSAKLAATAKDGKLLLDGKEYMLSFNHNEWVYDVTDNEGNYIARFNTKRLVQAKQWLKEWFI